HVDLDTLEQGWNKIQALLERTAAGRGLEFTVELLSASGGARMDEGIQEAFAQAARARGVEAMRLPSGPAHDAAAFGVCGIPTGMSFVPSIGGLSHCPDEATAPEDILLGAQILEDTVRIYVDQ
ncbi:MAG: M20/M25/M40 family metallo-hydrolase, partial [Mailhella sp.]|nr:M20/M25/M40 family metallo-hydrolase [Mailhella sp.]